MYNHTRNCVFFFFESNPQIDFKYNVVWAEELCPNICNNFRFADHVYLKQILSFKTNGCFTDNSKSFVCDLGQDVYKQTFWKVWEHSGKTFFKCAYNKKSLQLPLLIYFFFSFLSVFFGRIDKSFLCLIDYWCRYMGQCPRTHWKKRMC